MIPIYIASHRKFQCCEDAIINSIDANTDSETDIQIVRPEYIGMKDTGCTGFTNVRFAIPELLRSDGYEYGIYLDVDMIVLGDIAELYDYYWPNKYVCMKDGSTEVAVISSAIQLPPISKLSDMKKHELDAMLPKAQRIPNVWNVEDGYYSGAKLLHFTDLKKQPWFYEGHPCPEACEIWEYYANLT